MRVWKAQKRSIRSIYCTCFYKCTTYTTNTRLMNYRTMSMSHLVNHQAPTIYPFYSSSWTSWSIFRKRKVVDWISSSFIHLQKQRSPHQYHAWIYAKSCSLWATSTVYGIQEFGYWRWSTDRIDNFYLLNCLHPKQSLPQHIVAWITTSSCSAG